MSSLSLVISTSTSAASVAIDGTHDQAPGNTGNPCQDAAQSVIQGIGEATYMRTIALVELVNGKIKITLPDTYEGRKIGEALKERRRR